MSLKVDQLIRSYVENSGLQLEQDLPPLPDVGAPEQGGAPPMPAEGGPEVAPMPPEAPPAPEPEVKSMSDEAWVSAVKTMVQLLSYGLHAEEDAIHRDPIAKWIKMKDEIDQENAFEVAQEIDIFLAGPDSPD